MTIQKKSNIYSLQDILKNPDILREIFIESKRISRRTHLIVYILYCLLIFSIEVLTPTLLLPLGIIGYILLTIMSWRRAHDAGWESWYAVFLTLFQGGIFLFFWGSYKNEPASIYGPVPKSLSFLSVGLPLIGFMCLFAFIFLPFTQ